MLRAGCFRAARLAESYTGASDSSKSEFKSKFNSSSQSREEAGRSLCSGACSVGSRRETARATDARAETKKSRSSLREAQRVHPAEISRRAGESRRAGPGILRLRESALCAGRDLVEDGAKRRAVARLRCLLEFASQSRAESQRGSSRAAAGISQGLSGLGGHRSGAAIFRCRGAGRESTRGDTRGTRWLSANRCKTCAAFPARRSSRTIRPAAASRRGLPSHLSSFPFERSGARSRPETFFFAQLARRQTRRDSHRAAARTRFHDFRCASVG